MKTLISDRISVLKSTIRIIFFIFFINATLLQTKIKADTKKNISPKDLCHKLHLIPGEKAMIQWQRVFKSLRKLKKYGLDTFDKETKERLKEYLINHAADSDHPTVAGM